MEEAGRLLCQVAGKARQLSKLELENLTLARD